MPLLFSYGSLQQDDVQLATFGRLLHGERDTLVGYGSSLVPIDDPAVAARLGKTHHANVVIDGRGGSGVPGMVFEISEAELIAVDGYEAPFEYARIFAPLASGREAWVYLHTPPMRSK
jgi:hypothetical protein